MNSSKTKKFLKQLWRCKALYLMILPAIIAVFIFHYMPIYGVQIAFKDFRPSKGIWGSAWVGLKYFKKFIEYPYFTKILRNTIWISLVSLFTFPLPVIFALMLNEMKNLKLKKLCQTITYAPHFVSTVIVCSMTILFLNRGGLVNNIIEFFGGKPVNFMAEPSAFAPIYAITGVWSGLGWSTIVYMAALSGVSMELIEAAKMDGANRMQVIWHVCLQCLKPTIVTMLILNIGSLLSVGFEKVFLLQNPLNMDASSVISTYVYEVGMSNHQYSYSTAIGLFNNITNIVLTVIANTISKKVAKTGLW